MMHKASRCKADGMLNNRNQLLLHCNNLNYNNLLRWKKMKLTMTTTTLRIITAG